MLLAVDVAAEVHLLRWSRTISPASLPPHPWAPLGGRLRWAAVDAKLVCGPSVRDGDAHRYSAQINVCGGGDGQHSEFYSFVLTGKGGMGLKTT